MADAKPSPVSLVKPALRTVSSSRTGLPAVPRRLGNWEFPLRVVQGRELDRCFPLKRVLSSWAGPSLSLRVAPQRPFVDVAELSLPGSVVENVAERPWTRSEGLLVPPKAVENVWLGRACQAGKYQPSLLMVVE